MKPSASSPDSPGPPDVDAVLDRVQQNADRLARILKDENVFWYDELDGIVGEYTYERVLEVFVRVNNGGTKLDAGDLMFAAMKGLSGEIEEQVEEIAQQLCIGDLAFDKAWVLKTIVMTLTGNATLEHRLFSGGGGSDLMTRIEKEWPRIEAAFQQFHDLIQQDIRVATDRLVRSYVAFIPVVDYLFHFPGPVPAQRQRIVGYFHKAQLFNWFSASTDQLLAGLHPKIIGSKGVFPLEEIKRSSPATVAMSSSPRRMSAALASERWCSTSCTERSSTRHCSRASSQGMHRTSITSIRGPASSPSDSEATTSTTSGTSGSSARRTTSGSGPSTRTPTSHE
jgi:hypothetical protein